jgi:hypothetical protein
MHDPIRHVRVAAAISAHIDGAPAHLGEPFPWFMGHGIFQAKAGCAPGAEIWRRLRTPMKVRSKSSIIMGDGAVIIGVYIPSCFL